MKQILYWTILLVPSLVLCFYFVNQFNDIEYKNFNYALSQFEQEENSIIVFEVPELSGLEVELKLTELPNNESKYFAEFNKKINGIENRGTVVLLDEFAYSLGNKRLIPVAINYGGSGEFFYITLFDENMNSLDSLFVDADIDIKGFESNDNGMAFKYFSHHISQARVETPFVDTRLHFILQNNKLIEQEKYFNSFGKFEFIYDNLNPNQTKPSSFGFTFKAKGWLFENTSSAKLFDSNYNLLDQEIASVRNGEWMTADFVNIVTNLNSGDYKGSARVVLEADNASGIPQHDRSVEFWISIN